MNRYQRQIQVAPIGVTGQKKLNHAHVGMVGVGGLGSPASLYLTGAGVGKITLIDHDTVSLTNLHRQVLFRESDIDKPKVDIAKATLADLNHDVELLAYAEKLTADNIECVLAGVDVIVDACDNFVLSYLLSDFAVKHRKPLVSASVMQTNGYVGVYAFNTHRKMPCPSLRAVFPHPPRVGQDCNSVGVIGTAAAMLGVLQAQEVIKVILGDAEQLAGRLLNVDCWSCRQSLMDFSSASEPENAVQIIAENDMDDNDWVIDVRSHAEVQKQPKFSHRHLPMNSVDMANDTAELPDDKRLVFICASGQRALSVADKALQAGFDEVAVCL